MKAPLIHILLVFAVAILFAGWMDSAQVKHTTQGETPHEQR